MPRQVLVPIYATTDTGGHHRNPVIIGWQYVTVYGDLENRQRQVYDAQVEGEDQYFLSEFVRTEVDTRSPRKVRQRLAREGEDANDTVAHGSFDILGEIGVGAEGVGNKELLGA